MATMASNPTIVIVHGAWHSPSHMQGLIDLLESHGYKVIAPALPSMHAKPTPADVMSLDPDIAVVREATMSGLATSDVIVLCHSYGTIPGTAALEGLDTATRRQDGHETSVTQFLIIGGLLIPQGESMISFTGGKPAPVHEVREKEGLLYIKDPPGPAYWFYHDCSPDVAISACKALVPQAWRVNLAPVSFAGHTAVPTRYLICGEDNVLLPMFQRLFVDRAREDARNEGREGEWIKADVIGSSHSPFLSRTEQTEKWVRMCVGEGENVDGLEKY